MKKLLSILGAVGMMASSTATAMTVVSCGGTKDDQNDLSSISKLSLEDLLTREKRVFDDIYEMASKGAGEGNRPSKEQMEPLMDLYIEMNYINAYGFMNYDKVISASNEPGSKDVVISAKDAKYFDKDDNNANTSLVFLMDSYHYFSQVDENGESPLNDSQDKQLKELCDMLVGWYMNKFILTNDAIKELLVNYDMDAINDNINFYDKIIINFVNDDHTLMTDMFSDEQIAKIFVYVSVFASIEDVNDNQSKEGVDDFIKDMQEAELPYNPFGDKENDTLTSMHIGIDKQPSILVIANKLFKEFVAQF